MTHDLLALLRGNEYLLVTGKTDADSNRRKRKGWTAIHKRLVERYPHALPWLTVAQVREKFKKLKQTFSKQQQGYRDQHRSYAQDRFRYSGGKPVHAVHSGDGVRGTTGRAISAAAAVGKGYAYEEAQQHQHQQQNDGHTNRSYQSRGKDNGSSLGTAGATTSKRSHNNNNNNSSSSSSSSSEENELGHHPSHDRNTRPNADAKETARQLHNGSAQHTPDHATPHLSIRVTNTDTGDTVDASSSSSSHDAAAAHDHDAELGLLTSGSGGTHLGVYDGDDSHSRSRTETPHTYGTGDSDSESSDHNSSHTHSHNTSTEHSHNHRATTIATPGTSSPALSKEGSSHHLPVRHAESEGELLAGLPHSPAHFSARA